MKLEGTHTFKAPQEKLWAYFNDRTHLEKALPGCEKLEETEPRKYDMHLKVGIAAVKGSYQGKVEVADPEPPVRFRLRGEGSGSPGFVKGEALIELSPKNDGTMVRYSGEVEVGGLIAGVGQRLLGGIAKMLLGQFFKKMEQEIKAEEDQGGNR